MQDFGLDCVLLLEDEPFIAMDLEAMLLESGVSEVVTLMTCKDADAWLEANSPDLAIVDPNLKDGFCSNAAIVLAYRRVPFVVYSGDAASAGDREPAFGAGTLLSKPCLPEALFAAIDQSINIANFSGI